MPFRPRLTGTVAVLSTVLAAVSVAGSTGAVVVAAPGQAAPVVVSTPDPSWGVNGRVWATVIVGDTVLVGGDFTAAVSPTGEQVARQNLAAFRMDSGELIRSWRADADSTVRALEPSGAWVHVGGAFGRVGGKVAQRLARVRVSDAFVDTSFAASPNGTVRALEVDGSALYVGGAFTAVNGQTRRRAAKVDAATGRLDTRFVPRVNNQVWGIARNPVSDVVYVSGNFSAVGGRSRSGVAALSSVDGAPESVVFASSARPTLGLDVDDTGTRLFGAGGAGTNTMAAWDVDSGTRVWRRVLMGDVQAVHHFEGKVWFGFHEGYAGDTAPKVLVADARTGELEAFRPSFDKFWGVHAIDVTSAGVVVSGDFTRVNGVRARAWARFVARPAVAPDVPAPGEATVAVLGPTTTWDWWYRSEAPPSGWTAPDFDSSSWRTGHGTFGWGTPLVVTPIDTFATTRERPRVAYFRSSFDIADVDRVVGLRLETAADDGVVVHVNGVEVARENMRAGAVTHTTYAPSARRHRTAPRVVVDVPGDLLRDGVNVVSASAHVNFRATPDLTFSLRAALTTTD